jgi:hypothetical protein
MKDESDVFINGRIEDVLPIIIQELRKLKGRNSHKG